MVFTKSNPFEKLPLIDDDICIEALTTFIGIGIFVIFLLTTMKKNR